MKTIYGCLFILLTSSINAQEIRFPLTASGDKKYIVDQSGKPVFLNGCSVWDLPFAISYHDAKDYLVKLRAKRFNTVLIKFSPNINTVTHGEEETVNEHAFIDLDINQPNETYFKHVDSLLELCNQMNIVVMAAPLYLGCCHEGWLEIIEQYKDAEKKCRQYGEWIANRYKHLPNLIWVSGGDHNPNAGAIAFAEGIAAVDTLHLHTFHAHPGKSSAERFREERWHTLSAAYTYFPAMETDTAWQYKHVYTMLYEEMLNRYRMPCILIESAYERERHTTAQTIRRQVYWALLSGASGEVFGHRDTYTVGAKKNTALNDPGVESMGIFKKYVETIPWYKMKGDWPHSLFTAGRGNFNATQYPGGDDYATAAFTTDRSLAVLYMPSYRKVGVNMNRFKNAVTVEWFDPSSGIYTMMPGKFLNKDVHYFAPPSFNNAKGFDDWVLIIKTAK